jgi:hypothetical protein
MPLQVVSRGIFRRSPVYLLIVSWLSREIVWRLVAYVLMISNEP